jgi:hypothetical protein
MRIIQISSIFVVSLLLAATSNVMASDFRCGSKTISIGDHQYDVLNKCGEPSHVDAWDEMGIKRDFWPGLLGTEMGWNQWQPFAKELIKVEEWEYNLGPTRFIRYLRFENGRLIRITEGDYGY